ncbi:patatin-like phospholipase family protein [Romboutsia sp.]|uniref:patatin-like phospholipase family protein n=1 Tax=Romboutsia sp. TaxID=1965302 RepID=UPI003F3862AC
MKIGLCLCGGGAKGAYQAGVIKSLHNKGVKFDAISGTSIGAINGYYIFTENVEKLDNMWTSIEPTSENGIKIVDNTVDNSYAIDGLKTLINKKQDNMDFYVNYIEIENRRLKEKVVNLSELNYEEGLDSIKYSALLPFNPKGTLDMRNQFENDVVEGLYDGYKLDGGLVNNTLIKPLIDNNMDKIIIISTRYDYELPEEIANEAKDKEIIIVRPKTVFAKNDTLRFEKEFCEKIYYEGLEIGNSINI